MKLIRDFFYVFLYFFSIVINASAHADSVNKIQQYKLSNGLTILVKEDHRSPAVVNMIWYRVGSAYEYSGITGISHALEHMMFQGTPRYPEGQFSKIIAENGGEENAFTSQDYTAYYEKLDHTLLPLAFQLEADRMQHLSLKEKDFSKEIQVVREERRMRTDDDAQALTFEHFMAAAYLSTPYHNPTIGWPDDLKNLNIQDLRHWYHTWYAPNNATIVVVGNVKASEVFKLAQQTFGKIPSQVLPPFKTHEEPISLVERHVTIKKGAKQPLIIMGFVMPSRVTDVKSWKPYALTLLSGILDSGKSARLTTHLIHGQQIASQIDVYYDMYSLYESALMLMGTPSEKHTTHELKAALWKEIRQLQDTLVSMSELQKVKDQLIAQRVYSRDSAFQEATMIGTLVSIGLPPDAMDMDIEQLKAITPEQIRQVAREYFIKDRLVTAVLVPQSLKPGEVLQNDSLGQGAIR